MGQLIAAPTGCRPLRASLRSPVELDPVRLHMLLSIMEEEFEDFTDDGAEVSADELLTTWMFCVHSSWGALGARDVRLMREAVAYYTCTMNLAPLARVEVKDFAAFMLKNSVSSGKDDCSASWKLRSAVSEDPKSLHSFLLEFCNRHAICDGTATCQDLVRFLSELYSHYGDSPRKPCSKTAELAAQLAATCGGPQGGQIDLWEAAAQLLGRKKEPVELLLYDISQGASRLFSTLLLGRRFEAIYHSSVLVFGAEYWYGGHLFEAEPPIDAHVFGPPLSNLELLEPSAYKAELQVVRLGYTLTTPSEFRAFLYQEMQPKYHPQNYHALTNNCINFSDDVVHFLTGRGIPDSVRRLPELLMSTPAARLLAPLLGRSFRVSPHAGAAECDCSCAAPSHSVETEIKCMVDEEDAGINISIGSFEADGLVVPGSDDDMESYFDLDVTESHFRSRSRREAVKRGPTGELVRAKLEHAEVCAWVDSAHRHAQS